VFVAKRYVVDVVTGNVSRAGTDANVFLTVFGENGDSGERQLSKSETNSNKFERGQVLDALHSSCRAMMISSTLMSMSHLRRFFFA